jgi:4-amino-4-deoxy-L-arabinose transferase-like glycosyltransferase
MKSFAAGFLGALAVVLGAAYLGISALALFGVASTPNQLRTGIIVVVVIGAMFLRPTDNSDWLPGAIAGIVVGLAGAVGIELLGSNPSIGAGQVGAVAGAVGAVPLLKWVWSGDAHRRAHQVVLMGILIVAAIALVRTVIEGGALGHDESAYAVKTRAWLTGAPATGWQIHRAPLISVLALPVVALTESEVTIRLVAVVLSLGALAAIWLLGRQIGGSWVGVLGAAVVGASYPFMRRGSEFLTDVGAAALLLLVVLVALRAIENPESRRREVLWLGPLVAAAFYMRYQSVLAVMGIAIAAAIVWPRVVWQLRSGLARATGLAAVIIVPHLIWATVATGSPLGVILATQGAAGREFLGEGLVDYAGMFRDALAGPVGAVFLVVALAWILWSVVVRRSDDDVHLAWFMTIVVAVSVIPLGLVAHGEPRFVFFPVWLLICLGSYALVRLVSHLRAPYVSIVVGVTAILWLPLASETLARADRHAESRGENFAVVVAAANWIQSQTSGECGVLTTYEPQMNWYSGCATAFMHHEVEASLDELDTDADLSDPDLYAVLFEGGKRQPTGEAAQAYLDLGPHVIVPSRGDGIGDATIVTIRE